MEIKLKENKKYILTFEVGNSILTYTAVIIYDDGDFIEFIDKNGDNLNYNKTKLISFQEIEK